MITNFTKKSKLLFSKKRDGGNFDAYFRKVGKQKVVAWIIFALFGIYVISLIYPFAWIFMNSFKPNSIFSGNPNTLLFAPTFKNYISAFSVKAVGNNTTLFGMLLNSFFISTAGTILTVITSSCAAYIMAKFEFRGRGIMFSIIIFSMILPIVGTLPALLRVMKSIHLYDTYWVMLFLYSGGLGNNFILLYSFFKNISWQYAEAAYIDGAGDFKVFLRIMMPLALPAITSIAVLTWIGLWNEYVMPNVLLKSHPTIAVGLFSITETLMSQDRPLLFSSVMVAIVPIIIVFVVFQKTIMTNTVAGGLKG